MMAAEVIIVKKNGEVIALCYAANCSKVGSSLDKLSQKGYEEVTALPKSLEGKGEDCKLEFCIKPEGDVEIRPAVKTLDLGKLKSGYPNALSFKCYSASGENEPVQLVIKKGGEVIDEEDFDVTCTKKEKKSEEGNKTSAAFMTGVNAGTVNLQGAKVDVVAKLNNNSSTTHQYQGDVNCDKSQSRIAQNMAENGGVMNITQHDTPNTLHIGKQ